MAPHPDAPSISAASVSAGTYRQSKGSRFIAVHTASGSKYWRIVPNTNSTATATRSPQRSRSPSPQPRRIYVSPKRQITNDKRTLATMHHSVAPNCKIMGLNSCTAHPDCQWIKGDKCRARTGVAMTNRRLYSGPVNQH